MSTTNTDTCSICWKTTHPGLPCPNTRVDSLDPFVRASQTIQNDPSARLLSPAQVRCSALLRLLESTRQRGSTYTMLIGVAKCLDHSRTATVISADSNHSANLREQYRAIEPTGSEINLVTMDDLTLSHKAESCRGPIAVDHYALIRLLSDLQQELLEVQIENRKLVDKLNQIARLAKL